jgi:hypothetical protein
MSKYAPIGEFLAAQDVDNISLNFKQIEDILGFKLPPSAYQHRAWWSNNTTNNVMTAVWTAAGFEATGVDMETHSVVFCRKARSPCAPAMLSNSQVSPHQIGVSDVARPFTHQHVTGSHPVRGALKGTLRIIVDVDLTAPADPEWADRP